MPGVLVMLAGAALFFLYGIVFLWRAFFGGGFEIGVPTLNGITPQDLDRLNPAIMAYIRHLHVALAGFILATVIAAAALVWYGVRLGARWAWTSAVAAPLVGLAIALPLHYTGGFHVDWVTHLGPVYFGAAVYVAGAGMVLAGWRRASASSS
jgi:hypothetical protein